ncbi:MAG TPA: exodeoxyribonuclease VII small subunit [Bacteroidia bacterium]|nr:exodeoxyribonuclease VII small subunit [Bacteroidia bacterium]
MKNNNDTQNQNLNYKEAINTIEEILHQIENDELDLDELLKKVDYAATLILFCKEKLKNSETTLEKLMKKLDSNEG